MIDTPVKELKTKFKKKVVPELCNLAQKSIVTENVDSNVTDSSSEVMKMFLKIFTSLLRNTQVSVGDLFNCKCSRFIKKIIEVNVKPNTKLPK